MSHRVFLGQRARDCRGFSPSDSSRNHRRPLGDCRSSARSRQPTVLAWPRAAASPRRRRARASPGERSGLPIAAVRARIRSLALRRARSNKMRPRPSCRRGRSSRLPRGSEETKSYIHGAEGMDCRRAHSARRVHVSGRLRGSRRHDQGPPCGRVLLGVVSPRAHLRPRRPLLPSSAGHPRSRHGCEGKDEVCDSRCRDFGTHPARRSSSRDEAPRRGEARSVRETRADLPPGSLATTLSLLPFFGP